MRMSRKQSSVQGSSPGSGRGDPSTGSGRGDPSTSPTSQCSWPHGTPSSTPTSMPVIQESCGGIWGPEWGLLHYSVQTWSHLQHPMYSLLTWSSSPIPGSSAWLIDNNLQFDCSQCPASSSSRWWTQMLQSCMGLHTLSLFVDHHMGQCRMLFLEDDEKRKHM